MQSKGQADVTEKNTWAERFRPTYHVAHMDTCGGDLDRNGVEVEEPEKGHAFDEMWGIK